MPGPLTPASRRAGTPPLYIHEIAAEAHLIAGRIRALVARGAPTKGETVVDLLFAMLAQQLGANTTQALLIAFTASTAFAASTAEAEKPHTSAGRTT